MRSLKKFKERVVALEQQRHDIDDPIAELRMEIVSIERRLAEARPDLLSPAEGTAT